MTPSAFSASRRQTVTTLRWPSLTEPVICRAVGPFRAASRRLERHARPGGGTLAAPYLAPGSSSGQTQHQPGVGRHHAHSLAAVTSNKSPGPWRPPSWTPFRRVDTPTHAKPRVCMPESCSTTPAHPARHVLTRLPAKSNESMYMPTYPSTLLLLSLPFAHAYPVSACFNACLPACQPACLSACMRIQSLETLSTPKLPERHATPTARRLVSSRPQLPRQDDARVALGHCPRCAPSNRYPY